LVAVRAGREAALGFAGVARAQPCARWPRPILAVRPLASRVTCVLPADGLLPSLCSRPLRHAPTLFFHPYLCAPYCSSKFRSPSLRGEPGTSLDPAAFMRSSRRPTLACAYGAASGAFLLKVLNLPREAGGFLVWAVCGRRRCARVRLVFGVRLSGSISRCLNACLRTDRLGPVRLFRDDVTGEATAFSACGVELAVRPCRPITN